MLAVSVVVFGSDCDYDHADSICCEELASRNGEEKKKKKSNTSVVIDSAVREFAVFEVTSTTFPIELLLSTAAAAAADPDPDPDPDGDTTMKQV